MRTIMTAAVLLVSLNSFAGEVSVNATDYSCKELKALVKANKELTLNTKIGSYEVYSNGVACFQAGIFQTKTLSVKAADRQCNVGEVCDIYGGMF